MRAATGGWLAVAVTLVATAIIVATEVSPLLLIGGGAAVFLLVHH
jgi:hypothetical protein